MQFIGRHAFLISCDIVEMVVFFCRPILWLGYVLATSFIDREIVWLCYSYRVVTKEHNYCTEIRCWNLLSMHVLLNGNRSNPQRAWFYISNTWQHPPWWQHQQLPCNQTLPLFVKACKPNLYVHGNIKWLSSFCRLRMEYYIRAVASTHHWCVVVFSASSWFYSHAGKEWIQHTVPQELLKWFLSSLHENALPTHSH